jgi:hypothetical protein
MTFNQRRARQPVGCLFGAINAPITMNGPVADQGNLTAILAEHARTIAREVQRVLGVATREHKSPGSKTSPIQAQIN